MANSFRYVPSWLQQYYIKYIHIYIYSHRALVHSQAVTVFCARFNLPVAPSTGDR